MEVTHADYMAAEPFPHAVIDGMFDQARDAYEQFPTTFDGWRHHRNRLNEKYGSSDPAQAGQGASAIHDQMRGAEFVAWLEGVTGIPDLLPDDRLQGAGLHAIPEGGYLGIHTDFNTHPRLGYRRLNVLLFLNYDWRPEFGGELELWGDGGCVKKIAPLGNRMVVFTTSDRSLHGHPEPYRGPLRRSIAAYYYTREQPADFTQARGTTYIG